MKKSIILSVLFIASLFVFSCKKDNETPTTTTPVTYPDYSKLKVGNYWIYERYTIDTLGNATATGIMDSCYIESDTVVNSNTYFKLVKPLWGSDMGSIVRDSLHYIVDLSGNKLFSSQDFITVFNVRYLTATPGDTVCEVELKMENQASTVTVPAGTFTSLNAKETYHMYPNWSLGGSTRYRSTRYVENVGIIAETLAFFTAQPGYTERKLIRYHLN